MWPITTNQEEVANNGETQIVLRHHTIEPFSQRISSPSKSQKKNCRSHRNLISKLQSRLTHL
jgi:hypothetical protein